MADTPTDFANGTMYVTDDGRSYFLHHSRTSTITVGSRIRTTGGQQVTAGDAVMGFSYGWDARTGVTDAAMAGQISNRTFNGEGFSLIAPMGPSGTIAPHSVYLTAADHNTVFPDINVPGTSARAILRRAGSFRRTAFYNRYDK